MCTLSELRSPGGLHIHKFRNWTPSVWTSFTSLRDILDPMRREWVAVTALPINTTIRSSWRSARTYCPTHSGKMLYYNIY